MIATTRALLAKLAGALGWPRRKPQPGEVGQPDTFWGKPWVPNRPPPPKK